MDPVVSAFGLNHRLISGIPSGCDFPDSLVHLVLIACLALDRWGHHALVLDHTKMTREEFLRLLRKATEASVNFARRYVENELPDTVRFHVLLNQSYDGNAKADETVYPEDDGREFRFLALEAVADILVRNGRCPEWIDVAVKAQGVEHTLVRLDCCGRYTDDESRLYYARQGTGPFGIKSPNLPIDFVEGAKFRLPKIEPLAAPDRA